MKRKNVLSITNRTFFNNEISDVTNCFKTIPNTIDFYTISSFAILLYFLMKNQLSGSANIIIHTFLRRLQITLLHLTRRACLIPLLVTGDCGFLSFPSFNFLGFGSLVSLATIAKSEIEINYNKLDVVFYMNFLHNVTT